MVKVEFYYNAWFFLSPIGTAGIVKAVNDAKNKAKLLEEAQRHNRTMEALAIGKKGSGLFLKHQRNGYGLYLKQSKN